MIENSVVLPAPFGPISAVMRPLSAVNDALSTASRPPKRLDTFSTWRTGSATVALRGGCLLRLLVDLPEKAANAGDQPGNAARREGHHEHQHAAIDHEVEARRVAGHVLGDLAQRLDHQRAEQRA